MRDRTGLNVLRRRTEREGLRENRRSGMRIPFVARRRYEMLERNWQSALQVNRDLYGLLVSHHAVNRMDGMKIGQECPVCVENGASRLAAIASEMR